MDDSKRAAKRRRSKRAATAIRRFWMKCFEVYENVRWAAEKESPLRLLMRWMRNILWLWDNLLAKKRANPFADFVEGLDAVYCLNSTFVALFWGSSVSDGFVVKDLPVGDGRSVTRAVHPQFGTLYFMANYDAPGVGEKDEHGVAYMRHTPLPMFYHSRGFDFRGVVEAFWEQCGGRVLLRKTPVSRAQALGSTYSWGPMPPDGERLFGASEERLEAFRMRHEQRVAKKQSRSYLFIGPTGTGKTTFIAQLAKRSGHRCLSVPAADFFGLDVFSARQLLEAFLPTILLVEDVDHGTQDRDKDETLLLLARFGVITPGTAFFMTANNADVLDPAFVSRVNQIETLENPGPGEARQIFEAYLKEFGVDRNVDVSRLLDLMVDLPGRDIRQVAGDCRESSDDEVVGLITQRRKVMGVSLAAYESRRKSGALLSMSSVKASAQGTDPEMSKLATFSSEYTSRNKAVGNGRST